MQLGFVVSQTRPVGSLEGHDRLEFGAIVTGRVTLAGAQPVPSERYIMHRYESLRACSNGIGRSCPPNSRRRGSLAYFPPSCSLRLASRWFVYIILPGRRLVDRALIPCILVSSWNQFCILLFFWTCSLLDSLQNVRH